MGRKPTGLESHHLTVRTARRSARRPGNRFDLRRHRRLDVSCKEFASLLPGVGARNDGQTSHVIGRRVEPKGVGGQRTAGRRFDSRRRRRCPSGARLPYSFDSTVPDVSQRLAVSPIDTGQPESQNESSCAPRHTGAPSWRSGWALTTTLTSEATSPLVEPARTASGSHVAKDDRNAVLDGPGKREGPSCSPDSFALKDISPGRWTSSGQPERRPRAWAVANAPTQRWMRQAWRENDQPMVAMASGKGRYATRFMS